MRRISAVTAVLGLAALGLVGCAPGGDASGCVRDTSADASAFDLITVTGEAGSEPKIDVRVPFHVESSTFTDLATGTGATVHADNQLVGVDITLVNGSTGKVAAPAAYDGNGGITLTVAQLEEVLPGLDGALTCVSPGTRVLAALAPGSLAESALAGFGMSEDDSAVVVIDVQKVYLTAAEGEEQTNVFPGLPTVVRAPDGRPGVIIPDAPVPADGFNQVLIQGDGAEITETDTIRFHYTVLGWDDRTVQQTTWDAEPVTATMNELSGAVGDALIGVPVGSQVLVIAPAAAGVNDPQAQVYVIDILGVEGIAKG